jgi:hypothetical protein
MSDDNVRRLSRTVNSNLDEMERDSKAPFVGVVNGHEFTMKDPAEIDFKDLMQIQHPANFLKYALDDESKKVLSEEYVPGWKFNNLIKDYMEYYDLDPGAMGKDWLS